MKAPRNLKCCPFLYGGDKPDLEREITYFQDCTDHSPFYSSRGGGLLAIGRDFPVNIRFVTRI